MKFEDVKFLTKSQLLDVINRMPDDVCFSPNRAGNLAVIKKDEMPGVRCEEDYSYLGFVDFLEAGEFVQKDNSFMNIIIEPLK
jgi:hypothetical protein